MQSTRNLTKGIAFPILFIVVGLMLFPVSCKTENKPDKILAPKELTGFLVDVFLAEAKLTQIRLDRDSALRLFMPFEKKLMEERKIDSIVLKETYRYYLNHPAEFEKIFETVMDTLSLREQRAQAALRASGVTPDAKTKPKKFIKPDPSKPGLTPVKDSDKKNIN